MEIENNHLSILSRQTGGTAPQRGPAEEAASGKSARAGATDSVSLTPTAQLLRDATARVASEPVVDPQRVSSMREAVQNGSFEIDPVRVADKMAGMEQSLNRLH